MYVTVFHGILVNLCFSLRSFLIEDKCRFLSNFSLNTAEVELPGEFLLPKVVQISSNLFYSVNIVTSISHVLKAFMIIFYFYSIATTT